MFFYRLFAIVFFSCLALFSTAQSGPYDIAPINGHYSVAHNQQPDDLVPVNPANDNGMSFQWYMSTTPLNGGQVVGGNSAIYHFNPGDRLAQTVWFTRVAFNSTPPYRSYLSVPVRIEVVSANHEDLNYVREHDLLEAGHTDWKDIDALPIGQKLQTTTYMDGLGRPTQKVSRGTATPANPSDPNSLWGDMVQFSQYDPLGRQPKQYLPYTTTTESGRYKSSPLGEQPSYYTIKYNETAAFSRVAQYDNSPLNRVLKANQPGTNWTNSNGNGAAYELNDASDNVQIFAINYNVGDYPYSQGAYPNYTLFRTRHIDENGHQVVDYTNTSGQLILTKTQIEEPGPTLTTAHAGWICTYSVYDDFGLLRYRLQPEAVKWLDQNGWSFAVNGGAAVLDGLCFRYEYDAKKRNTIKKAPGAQPLNMLYDSRDRAVFMQDGNQANSGEWTANLYDNLDRTVMVALYHPNKTRAQLQDDITAADNTNAASSTTGASSQPVTDLSVPLRVAGKDPYTARNSITFEPGFTSEDNAVFSAYIDPNAATQGSGTTTPGTYGSPISPGNLASASITTIVKYLYYDDYSFAGAQAFSSGYDNTQAYPAPAGDPIASDARTLSMPTGTKVRALGTATFLATTIYYDVEGRPVQSTGGNIKGGQDVTTHQYGWDGRLLSSNTKHTAPGTAFANYSIITKNIFDKLGRVTSLQKNYGGTGFKSIAGYGYDDMGRLKTKHLDPDYQNPTMGGSGMEALNYSYNIHNQITGINKDYALKSATGGYSKWGHYFGLYLGYDDNANFARKELDGHVTGQLWSTQGDDAQRKYDFTYDNAGRLTKADFNEYNTALGQQGWNKSQLDFSVKGHGGTDGASIEYDLNGNLKTMLQMGVIVGNSSPVKVDDLAYSYGQYGNKLKSVTDNGTMGTANGSLGDFRDGTNTGDDYVFDANGNLVVDLNKNVQVNGGNGITYNFLDKPEHITIAGKGTIDILYDADGDKLQRTYTPTGGTAVTTTYIGGFTYQGNNLQFINFEEGRLRALPHTDIGTNYGNQTIDGLQVNGSIDLPGNNQRGTFDFFIRDYQQNVRMIVTEETHLGYNTATMETDRAGAEAPIFQGSNNELESTRWPKPSPWSSNGSASVSRLGNNANGKVGPNSLLKVMAGDQVSATTDYYYEPGSNSSGTVASSVLSSLLGALAGGGANLPTGVEGSTNATAITGQLGLDGNFNDYVNSPNGFPGPKAYLNMLFFDERFQFLPNQSLQVQVGGAGAAQLAITGVSAPKNGYAYIYVSNGSDGDVFFDNLKVADERGRLVEEDHFYSYGLRIAGLSSKKLPDASEVANIKNGNLYNDKELFDDGDLDWYDYGFRNYDAQIGRFTQLDPLTDDYLDVCGYQMAANDPINNNDFNGLGPIPWNLVNHPLGPVTVVGSLAKVGAKARAAASLFMKALPHILNIGFNTLKGIVAAHVDNGTMGFVDMRGLLAPSPKNVEGAIAYNNAQDAADGADILMGTAMALVGEAGQDGGGSLTLGTAGAGGEIGVPLAATGFLVKWEGVFMAGHAALALTSQHGRVHFEGNEAPKEKAPLSRYDGPKPKYTVGEHGKNPFNKRPGKSKTPLPDDAEAVFKDAIPDDQANPSNWYGINKDGAIYRFSSKNSSEAHFSGRSDYGDGLDHISPYAKGRLQEINPNIKFH